MTYIEQSFYAQMQSLTNYNVSMLYSANCNKQSVTNLRVSVIYDLQFLK